MKVAIEFLHTSSFPFACCVQFTLIATEHSVSTATDAVLCVPHVHPEHGRCGRHCCR